MVGYVHSTESFGTVDGPGIRFVIFFQGCPLRCLYCHNPDTWQVGSGTEMTVDQLLAQYRKNAAFYRKGGITATGGEPLMQAAFLAELFEKAKAEGIHTCLDTSGILFDPNDRSSATQQAIDRLLNVTDLVMLDIKHIDPQRHLTLTGRDNGRILAFAKHLEQKKIPVWIRHIIVQGYTDEAEDLLKLGRFIGRLSNLRALAVLPYHTMGVGKYAELGIPYPLNGLPALPFSEAEVAKQLILQGIREVRT